jgi:multidrug efflux pump
VAPGLQRPAPVNSGLLLIRLVPWDKRPVNPQTDKPIRQQDIVRALLPTVGSLPGARAFPINPPSLGQRGFQQPVQFVLGGPDYETLKSWRDTVMQRAGALRVDYNGQQVPMFVNLDSDFRENQPDLRVRIDRARAADLGVPIDDIGRALELMFGEREVSTFVDRGEEYPVIIRARAQDRATPADLANTFMRTQGGDLVPLSAFVQLTEAAGPQQLNRLDRSRSITINSSLGPGVSLGQALTALQEIVRTELPATVRIGFAGQSREFRDSSNTLMWTFGLALLVVFLFLAAQFESFVNPLIVMLAVPLAFTGGLLGLWYTGQSLNIYSQIGMILLIGLMTKNGILIVEFANQLRERGMSVYDAVLEASVMRLRPILMTSVATVCGAIPLALSYGAGSEARIAIGWVIVGGVSLSTVLTAFVVPSLYLLIGGVTKPIDHVTRELEDQRAAEGKGAVHQPAE